MAFLLAIFGDALSNWIHVSEIFAPGLWQLSVLMLPIVTSLAQNSLWRENFCPSLHRLLKIPSGEKTFEFI